MTTNTNLQLDTDDDKDLMYSLFNENGVSSSPNKDWRDIYSNWDAIVNSPKIDSNTIIDTPNNLFQQTTDVTRHIEEQEEFDQTFIFNHSSTTLSRIDTTTDDIWEGQQQTLTHINSTTNDEQYYGDTNRNDGKLSD